MKFLGIGYFLHKYARLIVPLWIFGLRRWKESPNVVTLSTVHVTLLSIINMVYILLAEIGTAHIVFIHSPFSATILFRPLLISISYYLGGATVFRSIGFPGQFCWKHPPMLQIFIVICFWYLSDISGVDVKPDITYHRLLSNWFQVWLEWQTARMGGCCVDSFHWWGMSSLCLRLHQLLWCLLLTTLGLDNRPCWSKWCLGNDPVAEVVKV